MDLTSKYGTDLALEEDGEWVDYGDGVKVKVARWGNQSFMKRMEALQKPHRYMIDRGSLPPETDKKIVDTLIAEAIIIDWEGVELDGKKLPHTIDNALTVLAREDLKDFRRDIVTAAQAVETYRVKELEESVKNSPSA
jgi:polyhydroxyalkanoate synthesis regulator phasin